MDFRIKEICKQKGLTLEELASEMGIARTNLTKMLNGNPTIGTLERISNILEVPIWKLFIENDFTALISHKGNEMRFNDIDELRNYLDSL